MCFLSTTFPNAPTHPHHPPILFDQSLTTTAYDAYQFQGQKQSTEDRQGAAYKTAAAAAAATAKPLTSVKPTETLARG